MEKIPKVTIKKVLKILKESEKNLLLYPNRRLLLTFKKWVWNDDVEQPIEIDVEARFYNQNYESIARSIYKMDDDTLKLGPFEVKNPVEAVRLVVERLKNDGYVKLEKQDCLYSTQYGRRIECDEDGNCNELTEDARGYFNEDERNNLEIAIFLTTKGLSYRGHFMNSIISEPVGAFATFISLLALIVSVMSVLFK